MTKTVVDIITEEGRKVRAVADAFDRMFADDTTELEAELAMAREAAPRFDLAKRIKPVADKFNVKDFGRAQMIYKLQRD